MDETQFWVGPHCLQSKAAVRDGVGLRGGVTALRMDELGLLFPMVSLVGGA